MRIDTEGNSTWWRETPWPGDENQPTIIGSSVLVDTSTGTVRIDLDTGSPEWQRDTPGRTVGVHDGTVVQRSRYSTLLSFDAATGSTTWNRAESPGLSPGPITVAGGRMFLNDFGTIVAVDIPTGEDIWSASTVGDHSHSPVRTSGGDALIHTIFPGTLESYSTLDGEKLWEASIDVSTVDEVVVATEDVVLVRASHASGTEAVLFAAETGSGSILWRRDLPRRIDTGTPLLDAHAVALVNESHQLELVDLFTGEALWLSDRPDTAERWANVLLTEELVLYVPKRAMYPIRAHDRETGEIVWEVPDQTGVGYRGDSALAHGLLVHGRSAESENGASSLNALELRDGSNAWTVATPHAAMAQPTALDDGFLVVSSDESLSCD